jgi:hypothetical protein
MKDLFTDASAHSVTFAAMIKRWEFRSNEDRISEEYGWPGVLPWTESEKGCESDW